MEFAEATVWHNERSDGLGLEFVQEVDDALQRIMDFPHAWASFSPRTRRCLTKRFSYGVLYAVCDDTIVVLAIMDLRRDPVIWQAREKLLG